MTDKAAVKAAYHTYNRILGRKMLQIVLEVPLEQEGEVHAAIGYPSPDGSTWVAIARLQEPSAKAEEEQPRRRQWSELSPAQQAGIACQDNEFRRFLGKDSESLARDTVCTWCGVQSRASLDNNPAAAAKWNKLYSDYQLWKRGAAA